MDINKVDAILEHRALICLAHDVFGSHLWSHSVTHQNIDFIDKDGACYSAGVTAFVKVELKSGVYHQEAGCGTHADKNKAMAIATAQKRAVTAALREALMSFGGEMTKRLNQNIIPPISDPKLPLAVDQSPIMSCKTPPAQKNSSPNNFKNVVHSTMGNNIKCSGTNAVNHTPESTLLTAGGCTNMDVDDIEMKLERKRRQKQKQEEFLKKLKQKQTSEDGNESKSELHSNNAQNNGPIPESTMQNGCKALALDIEDEALISTQEMNQMVQSAAVNGVSPPVKNRVPLFNSPTASNYSRPTTWSGTKENNTLGGKVLSTNVLSTRRAPLQQNNWEETFKKNKA